MAKIILRSKKSNGISGHININSNQHIIANIGYQGNPQFVMDFQKLLLKYYNPHLLSGGGKVGSKFIIKDILKANNSNKYSLSKIKKMKGGVKIK